MSSTETAACRVAAYPRGGVDMARSTVTKQRAEAIEVIEADDAVPEWKRQSVDRSLQSARRVPRSGLIGS